MTTQQLKTAPANSSAGRAYKAFLKIAAAKPSKRFTMFRKLDGETQHLITEPCQGEVHSSGGDGCMLCLNTTWGRSLLRTEEQLARFPAGC